MGQFFEVVKKPIMMVKLPIVSMGENLISASS